MSLRTAALRAGAKYKCCIAALWEVDDTITSEFAEVFYSQLLGGTRAEEALRKAKMEIRERNPNPDF